MNKLTLKSTAISISLLLAIFCSVWLLALTKQSRPMGNADRDEPDGFMENIVATFMNKSGAPTMKIVSPKMTHYAEDDIAYIEKPHVTIYRHSPQPWYITSNRAETHNGTEEIVFIDDVVIHHPPDISNPKTDITTTSLTVYPDKQQAKTADAITIQQPDSTVHAIGMLANLDDGTVQLLSEAKGEYVPTS